MCNAGDKKGKIVSCEGVTLPNDKRIRALSDDDEAYKYLGVLEVDDIDQAFRDEGRSKEGVFQAGEEDP